MKWLSGWLVPAVLLGAAAVECVVAGEPAAGAGAVAGSQSGAAVRLTAVRSSVYMLTVGGTNLAVQVGPDGVVVVDSGPAGTSAAVLQAIKRVSDQPIRFVIDTSADPDRVGNNASLSKAGETLSASFAAGPRGAAGGELSAAPILAHQNVTMAMLMSGSAYPSAALPTDTYSDRPEKSFRLNGEAIEILWQPAAHSDGDSAVFFRGSDVVATGSVFDITSFPVIDVAHGGSIQGEIDALNRLLYLVIPETPLNWRGGGTVVIPGRGRLCGQAEVLQYRDMLTIIRGRIQALIQQGKTLAQVQAAMPAADYAPRYGSDTGPWTTQMFVEAVYRSLRASKGNRVIP